LNSEFLEEVMKSLLLIVLLLIAVCPAMAGGSRPVAGPPQQSGTTRAQTPTVAKPVPKQDDDCGCEVKTPSDVLAVVNGVKISPKEVDESIKKQIDDLEKQVIKARTHELDLEINTRLLEAEAKKQGITSSSLLEREVVAKVKKATEEEALAFYQQNKAQIQEEFKEVKESIINYLTSQRQQVEADKLANSLRSSYQVKVLVDAVTPPVKQEDRARVFATVNGENITSAKIEDDLLPFIFNVQVEIYKLRKSALDLRINDALLEQEAQNRKVTTRALLDAEVAGKIKKVTEADARDFYDKNKDKIQGDFAQFKDRIINYLGQLEEQKAEGAFADQLRKSAKLQMYLKEPEAPVLSIATDDRPARGKVDAPVTIIEFTDYQCPSCGALHPIVEQLIGEYGEKVRLVIRDFPLDRHENAFKAAEAAEAAREQGKYWEYIDILFHNQTTLGVDKLKEYATQLGLDRAKFDAALDAGKFVEKVKRDLNDGSRLGIDSTPTVFINGRKFTGEKTHDNLKATIDSVLKDSEKKTE
jgi:protein-disulfide isomerase